VDFSSLLSLEKASPLALAILVIAWLVHRVLGFIESRNTSRADQEAANRQTAHEKMSVEISKTLAAHVAQEDERMQRSIEILSQMESHLLVISSSQTGMMPKRTQRLIVTYQWKWCRDEVIRIALNSIRRNGIKNAEEAIVTRLLSAWRGAAKDAKESLSRLEGVTISYDSLFDSLLSLATNIWDWMLPLYSMKGAEMDTNIEGFALKVRDLFDQVLDSHMNAQVEAEADTDEALRNRTGEFPLTSMIQRMADSLRRRGLKEA